MKLFGKDLEREVAVVAEIGVNHEGDVDAAARLIRLAHEAGADAVKLQSYTRSASLRPQTPFVSSGFVASASIAPPISGWRRRLAGSGSRYSRPR